MVQMMRAARLYGVRDLRIEDVPLPSIAAPDEVLLRIHACGICPSDLRAYTGSSKRIGQLPHTQIPGHEWAGEVVEVGAEVKGFRPGDRVVPSWRVNCGYCYYCGQGLFNYCEQPSHVRVRGGFCEYGVAPISSLYRIPDGVSYEEATFAEPLACCINGILMSNVRLGDDVVIIGAGPIGLLHLQLARLLGARVIVSEPIASRREMARQLGAHITIDSSAEDVVARVQELTDGRGAQTVIVAVGQSQAVLKALQLADVRGTINYFAGLYPPTEISVDPNLIHYRQLIVTGSHDYTPHHFRTAIKLIQHGMVQVSALITHVLPLERLVEAFELVVEKRGAKVVVKMS
ncbi:MAG: zinc-dependent alcohol dehydrogenase [Anaerolineae bacterium]